MKVNFQIYLDDAAGASERGNYVIQAKGEIQDETSIENIRLWD